MKRSIVSINQGRSSFNLSKFAHLHPVAQDMIGIYTAIGHEVTFLPQTIWHALERQDMQQIPPPMLNDLVARHFLVPPGFDRQALARFATPPINGFYSLYLLVSGICNMRCAYCVVDRGQEKKQKESGKGGNRHMSMDVADAAVRLFGRLLEKHRPPAAKVTLYGGEPTLNRDILSHVIPSIRKINYPEMQQPIEILCFTNGLAYDEALNQLFLQNDVGVGISLDGMANHHNVSRRKPDDQDSFHQVVDNYYKYRNAGTRIGVSCTIGKHNYVSLEEIAKYFHEELKVPSLQFQAPIQMTGNRNDLYIEMKTAARNALDAFKYLRNHGIEEGLALRRLVPFSEGRFHYRDCLAVGGELAVAPDGQMGPCHNAVTAGGDFSFGNVLESDIDFQNSHLFNAWHARMPLNMVSCRECPFIALCGGGCPYNACLSTGSIWGTDPQQCGYMEEFVNWLLEDVWERYRVSAFQAHNRRA